MSSNHNHKKYTTTQKHPKPKMLKEFLQEIKTPLLSTNSLPKTRRTPFNSFQKVVNKVVKSLNKYAPSSCTLTLSRSLSKRLRDTFSSKNDKKSSKSNCIKVKDIIKWRSFRDIFREGTNITFRNDDNNDNIDSDSNCNNSGNVSESESELSYGKSENYCSSMDELPCNWSPGNSSDHQGNNDARVGPKPDNNGVAIEDEKEQHSPVSVLNSPFRDEISDREFESSFEKSLDNMEKTKQSLLQSIQWFETLAGISVSEESDEMEEIQEAEQDDKYSTIKPKTTVNNSSKAIIINKLIKEKQCYENKQACIKEMENQWQWCHYKEDKDDLGVEFEVQLLSDLVNEVIIDIF